MLACVSFLRFCPWKLAPPSSSPLPSLGRKLFCEAQASISVPSTEKCSSDLGLAQLLRMGWFQQVHAKSIGSQEIRALLVARKQLLGRLLDVELSIRGILRGFGLKVGQVTRKTFEARIRELVTGQATLGRIAEAMLSARATLQAEYEKLHKAARDCS
jgi:hypothetical protein